ncbi:MAG: outer membrane beta-barrel protein [Acidobacteriota bacterium]
MSKFIRWFSFLFALVLFIQSANAQSEVPKFEVGGQFSFIRLNYSPDSIFVGGNPLPKENFKGGGGRLTYNINKTFAIEGVIERFSVEDHDLNPFFGGNQEILPQPKVQGFFGVKTGVRHKRYGIFFKARPGFTKYTPTLSCNGANCQEIKVTRFAFDIGGVVEGYLSKHFMVRADVGGTYLRYPSTTKTEVIDQQGPRISTREGINGLSLQISAGVGFRF